MGLKFGAGMAIAAASMLGLTEAKNAAEADGHAPRPKVKAPPKRVSLVDRVMSQIAGGLAGDTFVTSIESPKPLGKRAKRRLRGRNKEAARLARARVANYIWEF